MAATLSRRGSSGGGGLSLRLRLRPGRRRLRRERGTGFLELNALLLRGENVPEAFSARAAELIRTEFTGK